MAGKKNAVVEQDLSRFGKKDCKKGDDVVINADVVGLGVGATVVITEVRFGGVQFRVEGTGDYKSDRDFLVWAKQID